MFGSFNYYETWDTDKTTNFKSFDHKQFILCSEMFLTVFDFKKKLFQHVIIK